MRARTDTASEFLTSDSGSVPGKANQNRPFSARKYSSSGLSYPYFRGGSGDL
jgi:hypothetical protein